MTDEQAADLKRLAESANGRIRSGLVVRLYVWEELRIYENAAHPAVILDLLADRAAAREALRQLMNLENWLLRNSHRKNSAAVARKAPNRICEAMAAARKALGEEA